MGASLEMPELKRCNFGDEARGSLNAVYLQTQSQKPNLLVPPGNSRRSLKDNRGENNRGNRLYRSRPGSHGVDRRTSKLLLPSRQAAPLLAGICLLT
jgi:hypothetical protein